MGRLAENRNSCMERGGTRMKKFEYTPPEQPRELILKLGQKITDRIPIKLPDKTGLVKPLMRHHGFHSFN